MDVKVDKKAKKNFLAFIFDAMIQYNMISRRKSNFIFLQRTLKVNFFACVFSFTCWLRMRCTCEMLRYFVIHRRRLLDSESVVAAAPLLIRFAIVECRRRRKFPN